MPQYIVGWQPSTNNSTKSKSTKICSTNNSTEAKVNDSSPSKEQWVTKKICIKAGNAESWVVNSAKLEAASETGDGDNSDDDGSGKGGDADDSASVVSVASITSAESVASKESKVSKNSKDSSSNRTFGKKGTGPKNMEEFRKALKENLRTKDGAYCKAKDEISIECVCGKIVRICNKFYWKYMVQKPKVLNGKVQYKGHWFVCDEVKKRGNMYDLTQEEKEEIEKEISRQLKQKAREKSDDSDHSIEDRKPSAKSSRERGPDKDFFEANEYEDQIDQLIEAHAKRQEEEESEEEKREKEIKSKINELLKSREIGTTFLQDGPCYQVASELALCRECKLIPIPEREELILKG